MNSYHKNIEKMLTHYPSKMFSTKPSAAVIVCTGGGYQILGTSEGPPISTGFANHGFEAFLLNYSVGYENPFPTQMRELAYAVLYLRNNADELNINPNKIFVCGFSAGGHLAASLGTYWNSEWIKKYNIPQNARPDKLILAYPVIGKTDGSVSSAFESLISKLKDPEIESYVYLDENINKDLPPVFIWHNRDDTIVPVNSTIDYTKLLNENGTLFESHIFSSGGHANPFSNEFWFYMALNWLALD